MGFEDKEFEDEQKRIEALIASDNLYTRADALTEMVNFLANERDKPAQVRLPYILAAIDLNLELKREVELAGNYWSLSDAYYEQKRFDDAIEALEKSIEFARASGDEATLPMTMNNLGNIFFQKDNLEESVTWYKRALEVSLAQNRNGQATQALMRLTRIHMNREEWDEARQCSADAYELFRADDVPVGMLDAKLQQIWCHLLHDEMDGSDCTETIEHVSALLELVNQPHFAEAHKVLTHWNQIEKDESNFSTIEQLDSLLTESRGRNDATASTVINFVRARFFAKHRDYAQAITLFKSLLKSGESIDSRISRSRIYFELYLANALAGSHFDAAETAVDYARYCQEIGDSETELACCLWAGEHFLSVGMPETAVGYLEKQHAELFGENLLEDFKPGMLLARTYFELGRHTEALIIVNDLDARIAIFPESIPASDYPVSREEAFMPKYWPAQLHELKLDILVAMGDSEHAATEAHFCKQEYESIEDFDALTRMHQKLSSLKKIAGSQPESNRNGDQASHNFFAGGC